MNERGQLFSHHVSDGNMENKFEIWNHMHVEAGMSKFAMLNFENQGFNSIFVRKHTMRNYPYDKLPPEEAMNVLLFELKEGDFIQINKEIDEKLIDTSPYFFICEKLIETLLEKDSIVLEEEEYLPVDLCIKIHSEFQKKKFKYALPEFELVDEEETWQALTAVKINLQVAELITESDGKLRLSLKGRNLAKDRNALFLNFISSYFTKYNIGYSDFYAEEIGQFGLGYLIFLLREYGNTPQPLSFYGDKYLLANEMVLDFFDGIEDFLNPTEEFMACLEERFFQNGLAVLGLIDFEEIEEEYDDDFITMTDIVKTPLFDALFSIGKSASLKELNDSKMSLDPMKDSMKVLNKLLANHDFQSEEELNAFLSENFVGKTPEKLREEFNIEDTDEDIAVGLIDDAYAIEDPEKIEELLNEANQLSPNHPAYFIFKARETMVPEEALKWYEKAMKASKEKLGDEFEELKGHFWAAHETRPYMNAKAELADTLIHMKFYDEAIEHFEEMLELNPGDNQGIRYVIAPLYLLRKRYGSLSELFKDYDEDSSTFAYCRAFLSFLKVKKSMKSRSLLKTAFKANIHFPKIIFNIIEYEDGIGESYYSPGQESEGHWMFRNFYPFLESKKGAEVGPWLAQEFSKHTKIRNF